MGIWPFWQIEKILKKYVKKKMDPKTRDLLLLLFGGQRERGRGGRSSRGWRGRQHSVWRREQHDGWQGGQYNGWHGVQHSGWRSGQQAGWRDEQHTGCSTSRHYGSWRAGRGDAHCYNNNYEQFLTERNKISTEDKLLNMATEHMELKPVEICCCYKSSQFEKLQKEQENIKMKLFNDISFYASVGKLKMSHINMMNDIINGMDLAEVLPNSKY